MLCTAVYKFATTHAEAELAESHQLRPAALQRPT